MQLEEFMYIDWSSIMSYFWLIEKIYQTLKTVFDYQTPQSSPNILLYASYLDCVQTRSCVFDILLESSFFSQGKRKGGKKKINLRQSPFRLQDGDILGVKVICCWVVSRGMFCICQTLLTLHISLSNTNFRGNITGISRILSWQSVDSIMCKSPYESVWI